MKNLFLTCLLFAGFQVIVSAQPVQFKNRWKADQYINVENGLAASAVLPAQLSTQWELIPVQGTNFFQIKNVWKADQFLHIEKGPLESSNIHAGAWSSHWQLETVAGNESFVRIKNRWKADQFLHIEKGPLESSNIHAGAWSAQWVIEKPWACGDPVTDIDGNIYNTVSIGNQCWMKSNLKVSKYRNGDTIPTNLDYNAWESTLSGAYSTYNYNTTNETIYGKLYNGYAVADERGLCPTGWHVPTDAEWAKLTDFLGGDAGNKMKQAGTDHWDSPNTGANNSSGFTALPGGLRNGGGPFYSLRKSGNFWSATALASSPDSHAWGRTLYFDKNYVEREYSNKRTGISIRCLRD